MHTGEHFKSGWHTFLPPSWQLTSTPKTCNPPSHLRGSKARPMLTVQGMLSIPNSAGSKLQLSRRPPPVGHATCNSTCVAVAAPSSCPDRNTLFKQHNSVTASTEPPRQACQPVTGPGAVRHIAPPLRLGLASSSRLAGAS